jgi:hypothetical protein
LSYSRPPDLPAVPGLDHRFRLLPGWKLPTPARLNEPWRSESPGQDLSPALNMTALAFDNSQGVSASPPLEMYRIECRDYSERIMRSGLLRQASVELGEHLSMQPSSTERPHGGWLVRPLSRVGSSVYRVRSPIDLHLAVTVSPRRFGAERRDDAVDEINSSRASDAQQRADNSVLFTGRKQIVGEMSCH